jgi:hypothetical protein
VPDLGERDGAALGEGDLDVLLLSGQQRGLDDRGGVGVE